MDVRSGAIRVPPMEAGQMVPIEASFEEFFRDHRRQLFGALCVVTGDRGEAEEITQDAFLRVWERWGRVSAMDDPEGFLFRIAMNLFRNRLRRAKVAAGRALALRPRTDELAAVDDRDEMLRLLRPLAPRQRAALVLTGYLGYPSEEAARLLGIRGATVRALETQGRRAIRRTEVPS